MWHFKGFNPAYNAFEVFQDHETLDQEFGRYFSYRAIETPTHFFYAKGKDFQSLLEAAKKAMEWLHKRNNHV